MMEHLPLRRKVIIMLAVMASLLFSGLNQTILSTALPRIIVKLGEGSDYYSWVITIYLLTSTVTAAVVGKLSDIYGRKPFLLSGLAVFMLGTLLCGFSQDMMQLIIYRGVQGLGAGFIMSIAFTVIGDLFNPRERGRWQGMMAASFGLSSVLGPTLGGYIIDHADWHWIFWVFLPLGLVAFALIMKLFPSVAKREGEKVDYIGSVLLAFIIVPLLLALTWANSKYAWGSVEIISLLAIAVAAIVLFIIVELKVASPMLPLEMFKNKVFTVSIIGTFLVGGIMFGLAIYLPFFVQGAIGTSASESGYVMMSLTLSLVAASAISGSLISRTGKYKWLLRIGMVVLVAGLYLLSTMSPDTGNLTVVLYMIVAGAGVGIGFTVLNLTTQNAVSGSMLGAATAALTLFRQLGGTLTVSIFGLLLATSLKDRLPGAIAEQQAEAGGVPAGSLPAEASDSLKELYNPSILMDPDHLQEIRSTFPADLSTMLDGIIRMLRDVYSYALTHVFLVGVFIALASFVVLLFLKEVPLRGSSKPDHA